MTSLVQRMPISIDNLLEKNLLPDIIIRYGIRRLLKERICEESCASIEKQLEKESAYVQGLKNEPIAVLTEKANEQHYEVPARFFEIVLGKHLKYSCGLWEEGDNLDKAEKRMLDLVIERADIKNGQDILELGVGWGSLTLEMARRFPDSRIIGISNSSSQREFILERARDMGITNIDIRTRNMDSFDIEKSFDRIVSCEMFEHMKNYRALLRNIARWLKDDGKLFVHIFVHKSFSYAFEVKDESDWMAKYFFSGGMMPSNHLLYYFNDHLRVKQHWAVEGTHYQKTADAWLENMDRNKWEVERIFQAVYGDHWEKWVGYWRTFFMSCSELWGYKNGNEWFVAHYIMTK